MSQSTIALGIIFFIVVAGSALGFYAGAHRKMNLEQWIVGGRGFGTLMMWLLMAGEIYTAFSFLGLSGWTYSRGGPTLYDLGYISLSFVVGYFILPPIWELGRKHGLQTQPDFFLIRYGNKSLAAIVAAVGVAFMIPYLVLQLKGIGIIVETASFGGIGRTAAMLIGAVLLTAFVFTSGIRAVAWVSVAKDLLMIVAVAAIGLWIPHVYFGGVGPMFTKLAQTHASHLTMPGATPNLGHLWFVTTVLMTSVGAAMWPHCFGATYTAKDADTIRRNATVLPLYQFSLIFVFIAGFAVVMVAPGMRDGDMAVLTVARQTFPAWMLGVIGGAGALTAMVPAAIMILTAATLFAKNLVRPVLAPQLTDEQVARLAHGTVIALAVVSVAFAIATPTSLVSLLLVGYAGVAQFFPGVILGLTWKRTSAAGVLAGLVCGVVCAAALILSGRDPWSGWNAGFIALCVNFAVVILVSAAVRAGGHGAEQTAG
ncbi:MAG: sodium:solute symporter family protein [Terracidiphilus sp.]|jgi:SSS family solute:Na+ symporter